jgi:hypothetical protein
MFNLNLKNMKMFKFMFIFLNSIFLVYPLMHRIRLLTIQLIVLIV